MSILSSQGRIFLILKPVSGRWGIKRLLEFLKSNQESNVYWNGLDEITLITFNAKHNTCSIIHVDQYGADRLIRKLHNGNFKILLKEGLLPKRITKAELEELLTTGSSAVVPKKL